MIDLAQVHSTWLLLDSIFHKQPFFSFVSIKFLFILLLHLSHSLTGLFLLPFVAYFSTFLSSLLCIHVSPWFFGCGVCSALSLTLPFTLALPVLPLHAVGRGGCSVAARALVAHSHWGGSELREATRHPGKPLCQPVYLYLYFSPLSYSAIFRFFDFFSSHCPIVSVSLCLYDLAFFLSSIVSSLYSTHQCCAHVPFVFLFSLLLHH